MKYQSLPYTSDAWHYFRYFYDLTGSVWLDSGYPDCHLGRYDIISASPIDTLELYSPENLERLQNTLDGNPMASGLPFCGGWIGYIPYSFHHAQLNVCEQFEQNDAAWFGWYTWAIVLDHQKQTCTLVFTHDCPMVIQREISARLEDKIALPLLPYSISEFSHDQEKSYYLSSLQKINRYLMQGDCYQVNYAQRFSAQFTGSSISAYLNLRRSVPSPFAAYINIDHRKLLSLSPERFLRIRDSHVITQPIKGTTPRHTNTLLDEQLKQALIASAKNRSENVMIVDLLRNDLSQLCLPHSVKVSELFATQSFNNVHHLVSTIRAELRPDCGHTDLLLACFPGGSISGAPKKRALEIISELEPHSRGPYCGSIGYLSRNKSTDFNIAIRTLWLDRGSIFAWAGGGIVAESNAEEEYQETLSKIAAFLRGLEKGSH